MAAAQAGEWQAGFARRDITPPLGIDMTGYANRPGPAREIHDPLHVRALALSGGGAPVVLTCGDLLGVSAAMVAEIRALLAADLPAERLLLNHSHTHSGPTLAPLRGMGSPDPDYCARVVAATVDAIREAIASMAPARLFVGASDTYIGVNRRELRDGRIVLGANPDGPYDPRVLVLRVDAPDGRPRACWFTHGTHPVVMGPQNQGISAEWPGAATAVIERALGVDALFAQGCCGDVNPRERGDHARAVRFGVELAGAALQAWATAEPLEGSGLQAGLRTVPLGLMKPTPAALASARAEVAARLQAQPLAGTEVQQRRQYSRAMRDWLIDYEAAAAGGGVPEQPLELQAIRIAELAIVGTAAETFCAIGTEIARRSPFVDTVVLGYTNGCIGYLPTADAYPQGGYEIDGAFRFYGTLMIAPDSEARVVEAAVQLLEKLR